MIKFTTAQRRAFKMLIEIVKYQQIGYIIELSKNDLSEILKRTGKHNFSVPTIVNYFQQLEKLGFISSSTHDPKKQVCKRYEVNRAKFDYQFKKFTAYNV
jgi:hypothetical protein